MSSSVPTSAVSTSAVSLTRSALVVGPAATGKSSLINAVLSLPSSSSSSSPGGASAAAVAAGGTACTQSVATYSGLLRCVVAVVEEEEAEEEEEEEEKVVRLRMIDTPPLLREKGDGLRRLLKQGSKAEIEERVCADVVLYVCDMRWTNADTQFVERLRATHAVIVVLSRMDLDISTQRDAQHGIPAFRRTQETIKRNVATVPILVLSTCRTHITLVPASCPRGHDQSHFVVRRRESSWTCRHVQEDEECGCCGELERVWVDAAGVLGRCFENATRSLQYRDTIRDRTTVLQEARRKSWLRIDRIFWHGLSSKGLTTFSAQCDTLLRHLVETYQRPQDRLHLLDAPVLRQMLDHLRDSAGGMLDQRGWQSGKAWGGGLFGLSHFVVGKAEGFLCGILLQIVAMAFVSALEGEFVKHVDDQAFVQEFRAFCLQANVMDMTAVRLAFMQRRKVVDAQLHRLRADADRQLERCFVLHQ